MDKNSEYLFTTDKGRNYKYRDFIDSYFDMVMKDMDGITHQCIVEIL